MILFKLFILSLLFFYTHAGTFTVDYTNHVFLKDGKPFQYLSGTFHYFRIHPDQWDDRLMRIRAMGLNVIQTYVPWNMHEPTQGNFDWSGLFNLTRFLTLCQKYQLNVNLRATPFINAEFEYGGLPWWLLKLGDDIKLRSSDPRYLTAIQSYYNVSLNVIKPFLYKNGGPVLMVQIENEYGNQGSCDKNYTLFLRDTIWSILGNDTVLWTTDNPSDRSLQCGSVAGTVTTVDFGLTYDHNAIATHFQFQDKYSGGAPHVDSETYTDWYLFWGAPKGFSTPKPPELIVDNLNFMFYNQSANVNLYLILGSTNYEFHAGQQWNGEVMTSYWVGAPILENGNITPAYTQIQAWIQNISGWTNTPQATPPNPPATAYGQVTLNRVGTSLISTLTQIQEPCQGPTADPLRFEDINHPYGFVLYTTTLTTGGTKLSAPNVNSYGYVFLNNVYQGMLSVNTSTTLTFTTAAKSGDILRILVENRGRQCYWQSFVLFPTLEFRGLQNNVTLDSTSLQNWLTCGINLTVSSVNSLTNSFLEQADTTLENTPEKAVSAPGVYVGTFNANSVTDTFLDTTGWGKGQLFINGYNLGRYWPTLGPQLTLYVPSPILKPGNNTVLLIELTGAQQNYVNFVDHSIFTYDS